MKEKPVVSALTLRERVFRAPLGVFLAFVAYSAGLGSVGTGVGQQSHPDARQGRSAA